MEKNKNNPPAPHSSKDLLFHSSGNIPVMFCMTAAGGHAASGAEQLSLANDISPSQRDNGSQAVSATQSLCLTDLHTIAADIKDTLSAVITDLQANIQSIAARMGTVEQTTTHHTDSIRQVHINSDMNLSYILKIHRHFKDLKNHGCRHNNCIRGVPEREQQHLEQTAAGIFNDLLDRSADSPVKNLRIHRALRPRGQENDPPRDILCCLVNFSIKEAILRKA